jgi:hypothetical protein
MNILDYRYKGGFYTFEKDFNLTVEYPEVATQNCIIGICIVSLQVDCNGDIKQIKFKNALKYGIDEQIGNFLNSTIGNWNKCDDERYTRFEIPIQFTLKGTKTNTKDGILVKIGDNPGYTCNDDEYYRSKADKALEKKKGKRALPFIDLLITRNPYDQELYEMKKEAMSYIK